MPDERRIVTVLFADVNGSTELGETLDPEDVRTLLRRYYTVAQEVIASYDGTLEKFIGDAIMAVFGFPRAHDDDARRALAAALDLRDRVGADAVLAGRLRVRLGVNTGEVVASRDNQTADFLITGDAVNVAARLQQAAEPGAILCGERTAQAARQAFSFGPIVELDVKGKSLSLRACPVLDFLAKSAPVPIPLIDRDDDLAQLELVARRAFRERRPSLVTILGPAGIGKSRLLDEFIRRSDALGANVTVAVAQCLPYGERLTYWPLRAVLLRLIGIAEDSKPIETRRAILTWLRAAGAAEPDRLARALAATVGLGDAELSDGSELFAAWRALIELAASQSPLILAFEDLHWSSDTLLDLFDFLMQPRGSVPILMIALSRPELLERRPHWGGGRRNYVSLALEPLSDDGIASLVHHLLDRVPASIVEQIVERADGNPFYATEIAHSILDHLGETAGNLDVVAQALPRLPDTVQATVLARLDLLPADERRALQIGAVLGRTFTRDGVIALEPGLATDSERVLEALVAKDLLHPDRRGRFAFRHVLFNEVAYQTLPRSERATLHLAAARWLEEQARDREDSFAELIAYHYKEAITFSSGLTGSTSGDVRGQAVLWLGRAATRAVAAAASREGERFLRAAIELAEPADLPDLYERLGDCLVNGDAAFDAYQTALRLARETGRSADQQLRIIANLLTISTRFEGTIGNGPTTDQIVALLDAGQTLQTRTADDRARASFAIAQGFLPYWHPTDREREITPEAIARAEASARHGLAIARRLDDAKLMSAALDALGCCAPIRGDWLAAHDFARQRLAFAERLDPYELADAQGVVAWSSVFLGNLQEAEEILSQGLTDVQPGRALTGVLNLLVWRTVTRTLRGQWDDSLGDGSRARQAWLDLNRPTASFALRGFLAALDVARKRQDERSSESFRDVLETILRGMSRDHYHGPAFRHFIQGDLSGLIADEIERFPPRHTSIDYTTYALALCCDHDFLPPAEVSRTIADFAPRHGYRLLEGQAYRALGLAREDPDLLDQALAIWDQVGAAPYAARTRCERARLTGDSAELRRGREVLHKLGDLEQLERFAGLVE